MNDDKNEKFVAFAMKTEELKIIAEGMGYEVREYLGVKNEQGATCLGIYHSNGTMTEYNPLTNDTQCMEIMAKLAKSAGEGILYLGFADGKVQLELEAMDICRLIKVEGKTINEAVCKGALKHFKFKGDDNEN